MVEAGNSTGPPGDSLLIQVESGTYGGSIRVGGAQQGPPNTQYPFPTRSRWEEKVPHALGVLQLEAALPMVSAIPVAGGCSEAVASLT